MIFYYTSWMPNKPAQETVTISFTLPRVLNQQIEARTARLMTNKSDFIRQALMNSLTEEERAKVLAEIEASRRKDTEYPIDKPPVKSEVVPEKLLSSSSGGKVNAPTAEQLKKSGLSHAAATAASLGAHLANEHVLRGDATRSGKGGKGKASGGPLRHPTRQPKHRVASPTASKDEQVPDVAPENK